MLKDLKTRHFRCFETLECQFAPGLNVFIGPNAQGKTSLLEAACVLLRLQSPRTPTLVRAIQHERRGFVLDGHFDQYHLQFYFSRERKKLALDSVEQKSAQEYLGIGQVVWFSNRDIELVRGGADNRRRFLDFVASQVEPSYRRNLREYEKALRSRNLLLKAPSPRWREIAAFDEPLVTTGNLITEARRRIVCALQPHAEHSHTAVSSQSESLKLDYLPGAGEDFAESLDAARPEDARLRQTSVGPHRDDVALFINERSSEFASEGQQRTIAVALSLAQARLIAERNETAPVLLLDDIFGELDVPRRNALMSHLPVDSQKLVTTTHIDWLQGHRPDLLARLSGGRLEFH